MVDVDLAELYMVPTKGFNQAVKRNLARFPADFMFQLSLEETAPCGHNCDRIPPQPSVSTIRVY